MISGSATGTTVSNATVNGGASFNGASGLVEVVQNQTTTYTAPATLASVGTVPTLSKFYFKLNGMEELEYGGTVAVTTSVMGFSFATTTTTAFNPPGSDKRFTLAVNGSSAYSTTSSVSVATTGLPATTSNVAIANTVTYLGQETITIPAGTFTACKFKVADSSGENHEWFGKGNGAPLKSTSKASDGSSIVLELTAASRINGAPL